MRVAARFRKKRKVCEKNKRESKYSICLLALFAYMDFSLYSVPHATIASSTGFKL